MCNALVFQLAPTIICVCHLGTGDFRGGSLRVFPPCGIQSGILGPGPILNVSVWSRFV
jgi:hypothetical protein